MSLSRIYMMKMLRIVKVCARVGKCVDMAMRAQDLRLCIHRIAYKTLHTFFATLQRKRDQYQRMIKPP